MLAGFRTWLEATLRALLAKSPAAGAIGCALSNWAVLCCYAVSRILDIDNNACERTIRPVAPGRKNFVLVDSDSGGRAATKAHLLVQTYKLYSIKPITKLTDVLRRIPAHPINRVAALLPFRWKPDTG